MPEAPEASVLQLGPGLRPLTPPAPGELLGGLRPLTPPALELLGRAPQVVAPHLLGLVLRRVTPEGAVAVRITEVEAYDGYRDPGSHAFRGPTARNASMFLGPGAVYVYRHLGLHHCLNLVCRSAGQGAAVLVRAGQVVEGLDLAHRRREARHPDRRRVPPDVDLARGPARLAECLAVDLSLDGTRLGQDLELCRDAPASPGSQAPSAVEGRAAAGPGSNGPCTAAGRTTLRTGPRVGVGGDGASIPWRFWLEGEASVSKYRPGAPRRATRV